jgi:hypothetical protein
LDVHVLSSSCRRTLTWGQRLAPPCWP